MPYYRHVGEVPRKRHSYVPVAGGYLFEELMGHEGFAQESSLLYHLHSPSAIVAVEAVDGAPVSTTLDHPLQPRHLRTDSVPVTGDAIGDRTVLFANDDVRIAWFAATTDSDLYRDATGDQLVYVQSGTGTLESSFGALTVGPGDYVVIPTAATHRWRVGHSGPLTGLVLESSGHVRVPRKYLTDRGPVPRGIAVLRARPARPRGPARLRGPRRPRRRAQPRRAVAPRARDPSVRRRRRGTAASGRSRSPSTTSSRSSAPGISRRRCTRRSRATASSSARSCRARSTSAKAR